MLHPPLHGSLLTVVVLSLASSAVGQTVTESGSRLEERGRVAFTEGPVWHPSGSVLFSDIANNRIMILDASGELSVFRQPSGNANGLVFDQEGRLIACEGGNRQITRMENNGRVRVLADRYEGKRLNSPNDVTVDGQGYIYFTDPRYGDRSDLEQFDAEGTAIEGVYRIAPDGTIKRLLGQEIERPNGIAISPDDRFLFVAVNTNDEIGDARELLRFELDENRDVVSGSRTKLFDWGNDRGPDGMAIDLQGRLFVTAGLNYPAPPFETAEEYRAGVYVISPEGQLLETIPVPIDMVTNCAFGGEDLKTLFITAGHKLWSIQVSEPGFVRWPTVDARPVKLGF